MTGLSRADVADLEAAIDAKVASASRPKSSRQQARVTRVDADGTVWVHVFGGAEETPLRSNTASVEPGDVIDVTFTGLSLRGGGNVSDPAASSGQLRDAARRAEAARLAAESAAESAGRASEAAATAYGAAQSAIADAATAKTAAEAAVGDAADARASAARANDSATSALTQLSTVQQVVDALNEHADDMDGYIRSHLAVTDAGLWVTLDDDGYKLLLSSSGAVVYDPSGRAVSTFSESITFDSERPQRIGNDEAYVEFYDSDGDGEPDAIRIAGSDLNATAGSLAAMVRQYGDGVLVCRQGNAVGALVNADGSFDVVGVTWSGGSPTAGDAVMKADGDGLRTRKAMLSNAGTGAMLLMRTWDAGGMTGQDEIDIVRDAEGAYIALESSNDYTALLRRCTIGPSGAVDYLDGFASLHMGDLSANDVVAYELMAIADGRAHKLTEKADASDAIKSITRSGTTFTATRADGTTFTFTQQDNNSLTGVKGNAETSYRTGNVNLTPANIGAAESGHTHNYLVSRASVSGTSHAAALQTYFNNNKASIPREALVDFFSTAYRNGSLAMGYFLTGYDANPYGGFFVAHYNTPKYVGIMSGNYTEWSLQVRPDVLYDNATGTNGTVTLAYSAASYNHMRIYFRGNDSQHDSLDVYSPNGKVAALVVHEGTSNTSLNEKRKAVNISGTSITNRNYSEIDNSGSPSATNNVYITRVEAWNE